MAKKKTEKKATNDGGVSFAHLDEMPNLQPVTDSEGRRHVAGGSVDDQISAAFAKAQSASDIAAIATKFGIPAGYITHAAQNAPNFGQFGMVMRNAVRGVVNRLAQAKEVGEKLTVEEAAMKSRSIRRFVNGGKAPAKSAAPAATPKAVKKSSKKVVRKK